MRVLGSHGVGRPVDDTENMVLNLASRSLDDYTGQSKPAAQSKTATKKPAASAPASAKPAAVPAKLAEAVMPAADENELDEVTGFHFQSIKRS